MKQLLVLSGKGGTGKTTIASTLIALSQCASFADCDVDAPNLHLVLEPMEENHFQDYFGFDKARIDSSKCILCYACETHCEFEAIKNLKVDPFGCEGCGVCEHICPVGAITMDKSLGGELILQRQKSKVFSTAKLQMGSGASGKLVSTVKKQLRDHQVDDSFTIIDGSPGIGCPVIASMSSADEVLIVAEPTLSGIHDMKRIIQTAQSFGIKSSVCINKFDINEKNTEEIEHYCKENEISFVGKIPFDATVMQAVNRCENMVKYLDSPAGVAIVKIWEVIKNNLIEVKKMKVAVASEGKIVTEHFGHCEGFHIFETNEREIINEVFIPNPGHKPGFLPNFLNDQGVKVIISGGMGGGAIDIFNEKGIEVIVGASGDAKEVAIRYLKGELRSTGSVCHSHEHADECGSH